MSPHPGYRKRRAKRRGHWSGPSGKSFRKFSRARVLAWDGEGFERSDGSQAYGLLMNSQQRELCETDGLHTLDALRFLAAESERMGRTFYHVGFGISYDVNMLLADVPRAKVERIARGENTLLGGRFLVRFVPAKSLWLKDRRSSTSMTWYDIYGFHQRSFLAAAESMLGASDPRINVVRAGKAERGSFRPSDLKRVRSYCATELAITVEMAEHTLSALRQVELMPHRLDGAGAIAAAMLRKYGIRSYMGATPDAVHTASTFAYAGGRSEMLQFGYDIDGGKRGDMRSAYPSAHLECPCLRKSDGSWRRVKHGDFREPFALARIEWNFEQFPTEDSWLLPFHFRTRAGHIYYPWHGENWVWRPELDEALRYPKFRDHTTILDGWEWVGRCSHRPFEFIRNVYAERQRLKRDGDHAELALKLGLNSLYGKTAQHVGGTVDRPPPFHQLEWAGYITSRTRARLFRAARRTGRLGTIALMTDGLLAKSDTLDLPDRVGSSLGEWEVTPWDRLVSAQAGVYFFTDGPFLSSCPRCRGPTEERPLRGWRCLDRLCRSTNYTAHFRGFNPDVIDPDEILATWGRLETKVETTVKHFYTMRECVRADSRWPLWRSWAEVPRVLDAHPTGKRWDSVPLARWTERRNPQMGLMPSMPADAFEHHSQPYTLPWTVVDPSLDPTMDKEQVSIA